MGFDEAAPVSTIGRTIVMVAAVWGSFLITFIVVVLSNLFTLKENQKKAMRDIEVSR